MTDGLKPAPSCYVTTKVDDAVYEWRKPIGDPFIRHEVFLVLTLFRWLKWPRIQRRITVIVDADPAIIRYYFQRGSVRDAEGCNDRKRE